MKIERRIPNTARVSVSGKRSMIRSLTARPEVMDVPKSNLKTSQIHCRYWLSMGLSVPSLARMAAISLSAASTPAMVRAGSPGITRMTRKTMVEIIRTVRIRRPKRLNANSKMVLIS